MTSCQASVVGDLAGRTLVLWLSRAFGVGLVLVIGAIPCLALTQAELDQSRELWSSQGWSEYDYVLQRQCFCFGDLRRPGLVQVRSGEVAAVTDVETLESLDPTIFLTVDGLFEKLQDAFDRSADDIQAEFDGTFSYPTFLRIDYSLNIVDEELIFVARDLAVIQQLGDFNGDGVLDVDDLDALSTAIATASTDVQFDIDESGSIDWQDELYWIRDLRQTWVGDANLDGEFGSDDLVAVFEAGQYQDAISGNSSWATGDWNADTEFTSDDLVAAFQDGGYAAGPREDFAAVPEPSTGLFVGLAALLTRRRLRRARFV